MVARLDYDDKRCNRHSDGRAHGALTAAVASRHNSHEVTTARDHDTAPPSPRRRHTPTQLSHHNPCSLGSTLRHSAEASSFHRCMIVTLLFRLGGGRLRAPLAGNCPQASAPRPAHTRQIPFHRDSDGRRLVLWIGGHLAHSRLVFVFLRCVVNLCFMTRQPRRVGVGAAFPPRGPPTAFRGFVTARVTQGRAFSHGVCFVRSEGKRPTARPCIRVNSAARSRAPAPVVPNQ